MRTGLRFGGSWTEDKLDRVGRYLDKYMVIFRKYPNLTPMYVDAFAGTGYREQTPAPDAGQLPFPELDMAERAFSREVLAKPWRSTRRLASTCSLRPTLFMLPLWMN